MFSNPEIRNWVSVLAGALVACGYAAADTFYFHALPHEVDLLFLVGGLSALGIHVAYTTVPASANTPTVNSINTRGV